VVAAAESGVLLADELSAALDLPGNGRQDPASRRDKFRMQEAVRSAGLAAAECFCSPSVREVVDWAVRRDEWPVVLKPVLSAGADNVLICTTEDEVAAAHAKIMESADRYGRTNGTVARPAISARHRALREQREP
jgi:biotin carboxylase